MTMHPLVSLLGLSVALSSIACTQTTTEARSDEPDTEN